MVKAFTVSILSLFFQLTITQLLLRKQLIAALDPGSAKQKLITHLMLTAFMFSFIK
jgi:hypothetical protein